jgi:GNAT superfamily N-acetyltransferase
MDANALVIRPATQADLDAVRALLRETWHQVYDSILGRDMVDEVTARWHAPALLASQIDAPDASFLVAVADGQIVAHAYAHARDAATLVVSRLYVRPRHQRSGIGTRLFEALLARHPGFATLHLFVAAQNPRGLAFWRRHGFVVVGEAIEEGAKVLHMEKRIG